MRIEIIGGGPAGLYFAILMKKARPSAQIRIHERNRFDDTFGFGVVFSDQTLDTFEAYDKPSYKAITENFAYWDDIEIHFKGSVHRIGGNGFCGCSRRTLLLLLQERAKELGVEMDFQADIKSLKQLEGADLIIAADGINSFVREENRDHFQPEVDSEAEQVHLDGIDEAARRLHLLFQGNRTRHLHRPYLSIRARPLDLGAGNRSGYL